MYASYAPALAARGRYQTVDSSSRVEGASPHQLVAVLYDELLRALDATAAATARGDLQQRIAHQGRVLNLLSGLEAGLDFERGGDIAANLALVYREARRLTLLAGREADAELLTRARSMLGEIAAAWSAIGRA